MAVLAHMHVRTMAKGNVRIQERNGAELLMSNLVKQDVRVYCESYPVMMETPLDVSLAPSTGPSPIISIFKECKGTHNCACMTWFDIACPHGSAHIDMLWC